MMQSIKIVQKFFTESEAKKAKSYQRSMVKKQGKRISKIEVIEAHKLFLRNGWVTNSPFRSLGLPEPHHFMVVVYFDIVVSSPVKVDVIVKKITRAKKVKNIATKLFIVRLVQHDPISITASHFKFVSTTTLPFSYFRYTCPYAKPKKKAIRLTSVRLSAAA
jgi:hypothetical protein